MSTFGWCLRRSINSAVDRNRGSHFFSMWLLTMCWISMTTGLERHSIFRRSSPPARRNIYTYTEKRHKQDTVEADGCMSACVFDLNAKDHWAYLSVNLDKTTCMRIYEYMRSPQWESWLNTPPWLLLCSSSFPQSLCSLHLPSAFCLHTLIWSCLSFFPPCSISLPHESAHVRVRALLSLSNWWSFQIKMNLHHVNRGSGEQSAGSLQSAGIAGGLSLLSSGLLSLNSVASLLFRCKPTGHTEFTAAPVSLQLLYQWENPKVLWAVHKNIWFHSLCQDI